MKIFSCIIFCVFALSGVLFAQGTPHTMYGIVYNEGGTFPDSTCLTFKVFIVGGPDTLFYPADKPTVNYVESGGNWVAQISDLNAQNGDSLIIIFANICSSYVGYDTAIVDLSGPSQDMGITNLAYESNCGNKKIPLSFNVLISPTPFNNECGIEIIGSGKVSVEVFNVLGQSIGKIFDGNSSGSIVLKWTPENLPSGIYFVKAKMDSITITKRIFYMQ